LLKFVGNSEVETYFQTMFYRIILILSLFSLCSCERDSKNYTYYITVSGVVSDQVTNMPVEGAKVQAGTQRGAMPGNSLLYSSATATSGLNGKYSLRVKTESVKDLSTIPLGMRGNCTAIIATMEGFAGSRRHEFYYYNAKDCVLDLKLYHLAQLNLHLKNDTVNNNVDEVNIRIKEFSGDNSSYIMEIVCKERKQDSILSINTLWANWPYFIQVVKPDGTFFSPKIEYQVTPKPGIVNSFDIIF
jgi:hypothetical protein